MSTACETCAFFDAGHTNAGKGSNDAGVCRFNPPVNQPGPESRGLWPIVTAKDWCGHYATEKGSKR